MERWSIAGWTVLLAGLVLVASAVAGMGSQVVAQRQALVTFDPQTLGTVDLAGGTYTLWLEDHPFWSEDPSAIEVSMVNDEVRVMGINPGDQMLRDIEGVRCLLITTFPDLPGGRWDIDMEIWDWNEVEDPGTVRMFVLDNPGTLVVVTLGLGTILATIGAIALVMGKGPRKAK